MRPARIRPMGARQGGYTLMEITLVMAVIGLIMGGLSIGREVFREAEYNRIQSKFVLPWKQIYDLYYQRTGVAVGDSQVAPTLMVNGYEAVFDRVGGGVAGIPANYRNTGRRLCHGAGYPANSVGVGDPPLSNLDLHELFDRVGIRMPAGRAEGAEDRYAYKDNNGNPVELQICFQWNPEGTISGAGNVMVIRGLTPDLARKLDHMVDGKADAYEGRFRQQNANANVLQPSRQMPGYEWNANNTYTSRDSHPSAYGRGTSSEQDRVVLVTAHWVMDQ
ncbi:MAG TPA: prepilin-type cleavage/methylation domain-containing protein [Pseudomonas sp.]|nr:prepilin-type cleavage/methylation domain-containing protein [Pseudomonas sp.]